VDLVPTDVEAKVYRVTWPVRDVRPDLVRRGLDPESIEEVVQQAIVEDGDFPTTLDAAVDYSFTHSRDGRYGDGVFYSALEEDTAVEEVRFHEQRRGRMAEDMRGRTRWVITCTFDGSSADIRGQEAEHPELVSPDEGGYPFCREVARQAVEAGIDSLHAPSARRPGGTCFPVFKRGTVKSPNRHRTVDYLIDGETVVAVLHEVA
jgi:hypothetical protein